MRVTVENDTLKIDLEIKERIWACKRSVCVPLRLVTGVREGLPAPRLLDIRAPGTCIPGVIKAGTFYTRSGKEFWFVPRGRRHYFTIELGEGAQFRRLVLGTDDAEPIMGGLGAATMQARTMNAIV